MRECGESTGKKVTFALLLRTGNGRRVITRLWRIAKRPGRSENVVFHEARETIRAFCDREERHLGPMEGRTIAA
jgi:hypothetical protein